MKTLAAVIAGGHSRRMGQEKAFVVLAGKTLLEHTLERLKPQVQGLVINANGPRFRFAEFGLPVIPDLLPDVGTPLAGLHAALRYASDKGFEQCLTVPSDSPFLPRDLVEKLDAATAPAVAASGGQIHHLTGLWPAARHAQLEKLLLRQELRRVQDFAATLGAHTVEFDMEPIDPFFNINTPLDLDAAAKRLGR